MTIEELEKQIASLQEEVRKLKETKTIEPWRAAKENFITALIQMERVRKS